MSYGDNPIENLRLDWLGRNKAVEALKAVLTERELDTPLVVGVYGGWGTGKTSVMRLLRGSLPGEALALWFDAWKYARQDVALWRALLLAAVDVLGDESEGLVRFMERTNEKQALRKELDELATSLYRSQTITEKGDLRVNWGAAVPLAADMALRFVTVGLWEKIAEAAGAKDRLKEVAEFFSGEDAEKAMKLVEREQATRYREQVRSLEQFQRQLCRLVETHIVKPGRRLYLFIDDLDRCLPEDAVGALEAVKLFLDLPGCVFVLGMDPNVVEQGIRVRYRELPLLADGQLPVDPRQYLDKVIQIPFNLPPLSDQQMQGFIARWCDAYDEGHLRECAELIVAGVTPNPRGVKRTLNVLRLMMRLVGDQEPRFLAKLVVMQTSYDDLYRQIIEEPSFLKQLEASARGGHVATMDRSGDWFGRRSRLKNMLAKEPFFEPLNGEELARLVYATRVVAVSGQVFAAAAEVNVQAEVIPATRKAAR